MYFCRGGGGCPFFLQLVRYSRVDGTTDTDLHKSSSATVGDATRKDLVDVMCEVERSNAVTESQNFELMC